MADPKPFNELAAGFPSDLPAEAYDQARQRYFNDVVKPRLGRGDNLTAAWGQFKQNTERKSTLSTAGKIALPLAQAATGFTHAISKPLSAISPNTKDFNKSVESVEKSLTTTAGREGRSNLPTGLGELGGSLIPFALAAETGGASLEAVGLDTASTAFRILRGGVAFGALEAASADEGNRFTAGVKGFGTGLAFEGILGAAGKLLKRGIPQKEIDSIVTRALTTGDVPPEIDNDIAKSIKQDAVGSRKEGRPEFIKQDPNYKGVGVLLHDSEGRPQTVKVESGKEQAAVQTIKRYVDNGSVVDGIIHHPNDVGLANRFMRASADQGAEHYEGAKVIQTQEGKARRIALDDALDGKPTTPVDDNHVVVQDPKAEPPRGRDIDQRLKQLKDEEGYELPKGARAQIQRGISALWDKGVPDARKDMVADQLRHWELGDLIPEQWRREKPIGEPLQPGEHATVPGEEDYVARAKELGLSEAEVNRLQEIHEHEPSRFGTDKFEDIGTTTNRDVQSMVNQAIPQSEKTLMTFGPGGVKTEFKPNVEIGETPSRFGVKLPQGMIDARVPGASAFTLDPGTLKETTDFLGLPSDLDEGGNVKPSIVYEGSPERGTVYHEGLHVDKYHVVGGEDIMRTSSGQAQDSIASGLKKYSAYDNSPNDHMLEEAYVHAATAVRTGDARYLSDLVKMDGTLQDVLKFVHDKSVDLLNAARESVDSAPARILQRKMEDLITRTTEDRSWELLDRTSQHLSDAWYDPDAKVWRSMTNEGGIEDIHQTYNELVDHTNKQDGSDFAPSFTAMLEAKGVRGPFTPRGGSPTPDPVAMDTPPDTKWGGWTSMSGWFRPMGPWVADLHTRVNEALSSSGRHLPIYDRWKDVDEAFRTGESWRQGKYDSAAKLLEGLGKKQYDYFQVLTADPKHWPEMAKGLRLDEGDLSKINKINDWLTEFRDDTNIPVFNYLRDELPRMRSMAYDTTFVYGSLKKEVGDMSTFERLITTGKLDPKAQHIGSFMSTMLDEGFSKKFSDKPISALEKLINQKAKNGSYVLGNMRLPLENYTRYMRGIPDVTGQMMNKTVSDFTRFLGNKAAQMNKHLPAFAQLPEKFAYPSSLINKAMVWSYAAGLGLRASIPIRDTIQMFSTSMPVLGPAKFLKGLQLTMEKGGYRFAEEMGATLQKRQIGELYGDIFNELPPGASTDKITKLANKLLAPSRWGHNPGRAIAFNGEYHSALEGISDYRAGRINVDELIGKKTSLWFTDKPFVERTLAQIHDPTGFSDHDIAKNIALETVDLTLWPYRRGAQPTLLRTGAGRILGQFGMWPLNYQDFLKRIASKTSEFPTQSLTTAGLWGASNYAAVSAMNGMGADVGKWFWFSPAAVDMSPHAKFIQDLAGMWKDSPDGREARRRVIEYPLDFFPSSIELENIEKVIEKDESPFDDNGHPTPALLKVLGFNPLKQQPDLDLEQEVKKQLGFSERRTH